jgi:hypothetical protein
MVRYPIQQASTYSLLASADEDASHGLVARTAGRRQRPPGVVCDRVVPMKRAAACMLFVSRKGAQHAKAMSFFDKSLMV